jgi:hypothetical protein
MKPRKLLQELEHAAEEMAVRVSYEPLSATVGHGGLCRVKGHYRVIIDKRASDYDRAATLALSLAQLDTSGLRLSRKVREFIEYYRARLARQRAGALATPRA